MPLLQATIGFRGRMAPASLKRALAAKSKTQDGLIPGPHGPGLIEAATRSSTTMPASAMIPGPHGPGLIEAPIHQVPNVTGPT